MRRAASPTAGRLPSAPHPVRVHQPSRLDLAGIARALEVRDEAVIETINKWLNEER